MEISVHRPEVVIGRKRQEHSCTVPWGHRVRAQVWLDKKPGTEMFLAGWTPPPPPQAELGKA